jgi:hypothetical protein
MLDMHAYVYIRILKPNYLYLYIHIYICIYIYIYIIILKQGTIGPSPRYGQLVSFQYVGYFRADAESPLQVYIHMCMCTVYVST